MDLSEKFAQSRGQPVQVEGRQVHPIYRRAVRSNERFRLALVTARETPTQGVRLKVVGGRIQVPNHEPLADVVLWTNTMPQSVIFQCLTKRPSELQVWNCWQDERNVVQAWIGNAGMLIEETASVVRLRCNSAHELTFDDLVVELTSED